MPRRLAATALPKLWSNYGPVILSQHSETSFGSHPCRVVSVSYEQNGCCHSRGYGFESRRRRQFFMVERLANPCLFVVSGRLSRSASQRELALLSFICRDQTGRVLL